MKERPILFSSGMVRAILAGRKTVTRRVVKPQPFLDSSGHWSVPIKRGLRSRVARVINLTNGLVLENYASAVELVESEIRCPFGAAGDQLWVKETWRVEYTMDDTAPGNFDQHYPCDYQADEGRDSMHAGFSGRWRSPIHMPRWASRIKLRVESVRVERLHEITDEDAQSEGVQRLFTQQECDATVGLTGSRAEDHGWCNYLWHGHVGMAKAPLKITQAQSDRWPHQFSNYRSARDSFASGWEAIHGPGSWALNPWVWRVEFSRVEAGQ